MDSIIFFSNFESYYDSISVLKYFRKKFFSKCLNVVVSNTIIVLCQKKNIISPINPIFKPQCKFSK